MGWISYKIGIKKGDRVGIITPKSIEQLKSIYAIWMAEGIIVLINENSREAELKFILENLTPKVVLTISSLKEKIKKTIQKQRLFSWKNGMNYQKIKL